MRTLLPLTALLVLSATVTAQDRLAERTPLPRVQPEHTMERAGNSGGVSRLAVPAPGRFESGGYVGGGRLLGNRVFARGAGAVTGPTTTGTFGTDFTGFQTRPGRVFLGASPDKTHAMPIANGYRTNDTTVPNVFSLKPVRTAVIDAKDVGQGER